MCGAKYLRLKRAGAAIAAMATAFAANPAYADTETATAEITIVRPLSFVIDDNLDFGSLIPGNVAGTVTMTPNWRAHEQPAASCW